MHVMLNLSITVCFLGGNIQTFYTQIESEDDASEEDTANAIDIIDEAINKAIKNKSYLRINGIAFHGDQVQGVNWSITSSEIK